MAVGWARRGVAVFALALCLGVIPARQCGADLPKGTGPDGLRGASGSHWSGVYVEALGARGCLSGVPGRMDLDGGISRAAFLHVLVRAMNLGGLLDGMSGLNQAFVDVEPGYWGAPAIAAAYEKGWVMGYGQGVFRPESPLTRAEATVILYRAIEPGGPGDSIDARPAGEAVPGWAAEAVSAALAQRWLVGEADKGLHLDLPLKVSEACAMIWRAAGIRGGQYDTSGTVCGMVSEEGSLAIETSCGETEIVTLAGAVTFRNGGRCELEDIGPLDEVFIICGEDGQALFAEARYVDDVGFVQEVDPSNGQMSYIDRSGAVRGAAVSAKTGVYVLGNKSSLSAVSRGDRAYIVFDSMNGSVRTLDVVSMNVSGRILSVSSDLSEVTARVANAGTRTLKIGKDTLVYVNNELSHAGLVSEKDVFQGSLGNDGVLLFLQVFPVAD